MKRTALLLVLMLIVCMVSAQNTTTLQEAFLDENGRPAIREKTVPMNEDQFRMRNYTRRRLAGQKRLRGIPITLLTGVLLWLI
jgi:hypothetical protein